jgi:hypothetical protein
MNPKPRDGNDEIRSDTLAYDNNGISNPNDGRLNPLLFLLIHEGEFTALLPKEKTE